MKNIVFNEEKNEMLFRTRGVKFDYFIEYIENHQCMIINSKNHANQKIFVAIYNNYPYCIPFVEDEKKIFLKTIFPNRKFKYLLKI